MHNVAAVLLIVLHVAVAAAPEKCDHCHYTEPFEKILKAYDEGDTKVAHSTVHVLWPTHVEVIATTKDIGGWESPTLHEALAKEAIRGATEFGEKISPALPKGHPVWRHAQIEPDDPNEAFFAWQKLLFLHGGDIEKAKAAKSLETEVAPPSEATTTWPELQALPEYARVRLVVDKLSRRYMQRSGIVKDTAQNLKMSMFSWAAVHGPGDFQTMRSFPGEYHIALFYAKAGPKSGKLRLGDPRGHSPPFGREFFHTPRAGDLIIFPSWINQMSTMEGDGEDGGETVVYAFHVRPQAGPLAPEEWLHDPLSDIRLTRPVPFNPGFIKDVRLEL